MKIIYCVVQTRNNNFSSLIKNKNITTIPRKFTLKYESVNLEDILSKIGFEKTTFLKIKISLYSIDDISLYANFLNTGQKMENKQNTSEKQNLQAHLNV